VGDDVINGVSSVPEGISELLSRIEETTVSLGEIAGEGSPLADPDAYELAGRLGRAGDGVSAGGGSLPMEIVALVRDQAAFNVYSSLSGAFRHHLFDTLFSRYSRAIEEAHLRLISKSMQDDDDGYYTRENEKITSFCLRSTTNRSTDLFLRRYEEMHRDPRIALAYHELDAMYRELRSSFRHQLDGFEAFHHGFSSLMGMLLAASGGEGEALPGAWRDAFLESADLMRDAENVLTSMDISFAYLAPADGWSELERKRGGIDGVRRKLESDLEVLMSYSRSDVASIADLAVYVNMIRARARGVHPSVGALPPVWVPEALRVDIFRSLNEVVLNAIKFASLDKENRSMTMEGEERGSILRIGVSDDGPGIPKAHLSPDPTGKGGLSRVMRTAKRHGWGFSIRPRTGGGTEAEIRIDMKGWPGMQAGTLGARTTLVECGAVLGGAAAMAGLVMPATLL